MCKRLDKALADFYTDAVIKGQPVILAGDMLRDLVEHDDEAMAEAKARFKSLKAVVDERGERACIVTSTHLKALTWALSPPTGASHV